MEQLFNDFISRYEEKRKSFIGDLYPKLPWYLTFKQSKVLAAEDVIQEESNFYNEILDDMKGIQNLRGKMIDKKEWKSMTLFLKNHNERLHSIIDNLGAISAFFALLAAIFTILAKEEPINWVPFVITIYMSIQVFNQRIEKRHELSRNKELINILEMYLEKNG